AAAGVADQPLLTPQQVAAISGLRPRRRRLEVAAGVSLGDRERTESTGAEQQVSDLAALVAAAPCPEGDGGEHRGAQAGGQHQVTPGDHADEREQLIERGEAAAPGPRDEVSVRPPGAQGLEGARRRLFPLVVLDQRAERDRRARGGGVTEDPLQVSGRRVSGHLADQSHAGSGPVVPAKSRGSTLLAPPGVPGGADFAGWGAGANCSIASARGSSPLPPVPTSSWTNASRPSQSQAIESTAPSSNR